MFMLKSRVGSLPGHIQSVYVQNILKLYSYIMAKAEEEVSLPSNSKLL
jgi:AP-3 complex subunit delta-1